MEPNYQFTSVISDNALQVLQARYLNKKDQDADQETPHEMFWRVAEAVGQAERKWGEESSVKHWTRIFYRLMSSLAFLPNSPTLMNAGTESGQLSACFVLPIEDSLDKIFKTLRQTARIHQAGGGTGFNFSPLRPKGTPLIRTGGFASGPLSFIHVFDTATEQVKQGGRRRGANMAMLNVDHPDIEAFIGSKRDGSQLHNFNLSVGISDSFMKAVEKDQSWDLLDPRTRKTVRTISASELWQQILDNAWECGDPGLIFLDTINASHPTPLLGKIKATNPCGEVPLLAYEACNLGSINLSMMVGFENGGTIGVNWEELEQTISSAVRFLDNIIEVNQFPFAQVRKMSLSNRKIGLGVMGWAEMLIKLGIPYASEEAVELAGRLMQFIQEKSKEASAALAKERGNFPNWEKSIYYPDRPIRNATCTSIAPTGSISIIADTSPSIEPLFALAYQRKFILQDEVLTTINSLFINYLYDNQLPVSDILEKVFNRGSAVGIKELSEKAKELFKTTMEISPDWHLRHQMAFQQFTDNAVSKTVNLPASAKPEDIGQLYLTAWRQKAKGITVFRNDIGKNQVLNKGVTLEYKDCKVCMDGVK